MIVSQPDLLLESCYINMDPTVGEGVDYDERSLTSEETVWFSDSSETIPDSSGSDISNASAELEEQNNLVPPSDESPRPSQISNSSFDAPEWPPVISPRPFGSSRSPKDASDTTEEDYDMYPKPSGGRHTAILRTNRQISLEASSLMYSDLHMVLRPRDLVEFGSRTDIFIPSESIWRHQPWEDSFTASSSGRTIYDGPERSGPIEPYVFSRFRKIIFDPNFDLDRSNLDEHPPPFRVGPDMTVPPEDEKALVLYVKRSRIIENLARLLARSDFISELTLILSVKIHPYFEGEGMTLMFPDLNPSWKDGEKTQRACQRATELFLERGLLNPLSGLCNVRSFTWKIDTRMDGIFNDPPVTKHYELQSIYAQILTDLKAMIEQNNVARQGASSKTA